MKTNHANIAQMGLFYLVSLSTFSVLADSSLSVNSSGGAINPMAELSNSGRSGVAQRSTSADFSIRLRGSCYATNLRAVANPISPNSTLKMSGQISINGGTATDFSVQVPSQIVVGGGLSGSGTVNLDMSMAVGLPSNARMAATGNMVLIKLLNADTSKLDPVTAKISETKNVFSVTGVSFYQITNTTPAAPTVEEWAKYKDYAHARGNYTYEYQPYVDQILNRTYTAKDGPMSGTVSVGKSSDGKVVDILASFPGEAMFCGGYYSPLMVFFDNARPKFNNVSAFDMGTGLQTHWPEKNHAGYFIGLPKNGKITSRDQLFGEESNFKNGFLKLAKYDTNKDGIIDAKDPIFKKLVLWKDKKGLGIYNPADSIPLSSKIKSINLNYKSQIEPVGAFAELREKSYFEFVSDKSTSLQKGEVIDVWLKPAPKN